MVVDNGQIKEYDSPQILLKNESGSFYQYIKRSGLLEVNEESKDQTSND